MEIETLVCARLLGIDFGSLFILTSGLHNKFPREKLSDVCWLVSVRESQINNSSNPHLVTVFGPCF